MVKDEEIRNIEEVMEHYFRLSSMFGYKEDASVDVETIKEKLFITLMKFDEFEIPDSYKEIVNDFDSIGISAYRSLFIKKQGFALLSHDWIDELVKYINGRKCLEVMAGCGSLSKILKDKGVDIIATDNFSWNGAANWNTSRNYWTDIEDIDCIKAIEKYGADRDVIIMSWPFMDDNAYKCLMTMRKINPEAVMICIGEGYGGCTADDSFYDAINEIDDEDTKRINENYIQWFGLHDRIYIIK